MLRVNYVFMNRYMVTASIRADGSSRLVDKWSYFPSAALAWDLKQESFFERQQLYRPIETSPRLWFCR